MQYLDQRAACYESAHIIKYYEFFQEICNAGAGSDYHLFEGVVSMAFSACGCSAFRIDRLALCSISKDSCDKKDRISAVGNSAFG